MQLKYKSIPFEQSHFKALDDTQGITEQIVSVYQVEDSYNECMVLGCYAESLKNRMPNGLFSHDPRQPVAKTLEAKELRPGDPLLPPAIAQYGGLYIKAQYNLETQRGREAYSDLKNGFVKEFSVGYQELESTEENGKRYVTKVDLTEWSSVIRGANPDTNLISAKTGIELDTSMPITEKEGRVFNSANKTLLKEHATALRTYAKEFTEKATAIEKLLTDSEPVKPPMEQPKQLNTARLRVIRSKSQTIRS